MRDNEIIKALECCSVGTFACDEQCPCFHSKSNLKVTSCRFELIGDVLDLINRQKAEIERLQKLLDDKCDRCIAKDRAEAIKEFAERLKAKEAMHFCKCGEAFVYTDLFNSEIDNLVKEVSEPTILDKKAEGEHNSSPIVDKQN